MTRNEFRKTENRQLKVPCVAALSVGILSISSLSGFAKPASQPFPLDNSDFQIKKITPSQSESRINPPEKTSIKVQPPPDTAGKTPEIVPKPPVVGKPQEQPIPPIPQDSSFETSFTSWPASGKQPIAAILSIHGFGLYKESFAGFAKRMAGRGISTYAIDVRGFGSWKGAPGEDKKLDFYQTMMDLRSAIYWVKTMNPGVPVFLLGESMGGAIALQATALFPEYVSGLIASVPGSQYYGGKKTAMEVALRMVRPNSKFNVGDKVIERATSNKNLRDNWAKDPRAKLEMTPKQMAQFATFMNQSDEMAKRIESVPVLMLQGGRDKLSRADGTLRLFNALKTPYKNYVLLDEAEHLIFEKGQYDVRTAEIVENWLTKQSQRLKSAGFGNPK
ncbi:MAG: alpha/beta fold hydrolase [Candidatus Melainabacteria bacterium]|nr:alpha/beta fold hydrolase [Candidatus Melainabacteria bacterium]